MSTLLTRMLSIMEEAEIKPKQMTTILDISVSSFTDWKKGKGSPSVATLSKFADYFHVSLDYLVYGTKIEPILSPKETELLSKFNSLSPECQDKVLTYIDGMIAVLSDKTD